MANQSFIQRSYQQIAKAANSKKVRRAVLATLIAGTSFAAIGNANAGDRVQPGGISILVHEFQPEPSNVTANATATNDQAEVATTPKAAVKADAQVASLGTHDSVFIAPTDIAPTNIDNTDEIDGLELADSSDLVDTCTFIDPVSLSDSDESIDSTELADVIESEASIIEKASSHFDRTIAAAVAASAAKLGISIEQVLEPFAMVGPIANHAPATMPIDADFTVETDDESAIAGFIEDVTADAAPTNKQLAAAVALNRWWLDTETVAIAKEITAPIARAFEVAVDSASEPTSEQVAAEKAESIEAAIQQLASEEPLDVQNESLINGDEKLVGSSPMIVTIQDAYMPYDLAQRDLELNLLPLTTVVPISPKNYVERPTQESSADAVVAATEPVPQREANIQASPECLLGEFLHDASELVDATQVRDLTFAGLGESFGEWVATLSPKRAAVANAAAVVKVAVAKEAAVSAADIAMMEVNGQAIPAPVADPIPNAEKALEIAKIDSVPVMVVEGEIVPAPVADPAPNANDRADKLAVMEVDGRMIPAPVADPVPNAEPEQIATSNADENDLAIAVPSAETQIAAQVAEVQSAELQSAEVQPAVVKLGQPTVVATQADVADLIATIGQWQRQAINSILALPSESASDPASDSPSELATDLAVDLASDSTKATVASPEAAVAPAIEVAEKVAAPGETKLR